MHKKALGSFLKGNRREFLIGLAAAGIATSARSASSEIKLAAIFATSGPWARPGSLAIEGAKLAVADINAQGGVKAAGGAKIKLVVYDAGDSSETAKNAAQRMVAEHPDVTGVVGAWLSAFTLPVSEVTERAKIPLITGSAANKITTRGFKYIFRTVPTGTAWVEQLAPGITSTVKSISGKPPQTAALIGDSTPAAVNWADIFRKEVLPELGVKLLVDETFTPPIADTTTLVQKVRRAKPDVFINIATNVPDSKLFLDKMGEFNLKVPTVFIANAMASSEVANLITPNELDGTLVAVNNWGTSSRQAIVDKFTERTGEPFMGQDSSNVYGDIWLLKEAMESAGSSNPEKVATALRDINLPSDKGAGRLYYGGKRLEFDEAGNRVGAGMMLLQWQDGSPVIVYPTEMAGGEPLSP